MRINIAVDRSGSIAQPEPQLSIRFDNTTDDSGTNILRVELVVDRTQQELDGHEVASN